MARVASPYTRLCDAPFSSPTYDMRSSSQPIIIPPKSTYAEIPLTVVSSGIYYYNSTRLWASPPSGYSFSSPQWGGSVVVYSPTKLYAILESAGGTTYLYSMNTTTKAWTQIQLLGSSAHELVHGFITTSMFRSHNYAAILVWSHPGELIEYIYSLDMSTGTATLIKTWAGSAYVALDTSYTTSDGNRPPVLGENGYLYYTLQSLAGVHTIRKTPIASFSDTEIAYGGAANNYFHVLSDGYYTRSDDLSKIYNEAGTDDWTVTYDVYGGYKVGTDGSDGAWLLNTAYGLYAAYLDSGSSTGTIHRLHAGLPTQSPRGWYGSSMAIYNSGQGYDAANPQTMFISVGISSDSRMGFIRMDRGGLE